MAELESILHAGESPSHAYYSTLDFLVYAQAMGIADLGRVIKILGLVANA